jgi:hypothetical protein
MCTVCNHDPNWIQNLTETIFAPFIVAAVTYFLFGKVDELRKRKNFSKLGVAIIDTLIEEVESGRNSIRNILDPKNNVIPNPLPRKSWNGINTITDDVLLRIFAVSKKSKDVGFPAKEVRSHTKNYFDHMVPNWDLVINEAAQGNDFKSYAIATFSTYDQAATGVLDMLNHIKELLENNTKRIWPK